MFCLGFCAVLNGRLYTRGRIICLNEYGQTFVVPLVICLVLGYLRDRNAAAHSVDSDIF